MKKFKTLCLEVIDIIIDEWKFFLCLILITIICLFPMDYYIVIGGGINDVSKRIEVEDGYSSKGSFNLSYVRQLNGTVLTYGLSFIIPGWDRLEIGDYKYDESESIEDINFRSDLDLKNANTLAIKNAYDLAKKDVEIKDGHFYVIFVTDDYDTDFLIQDEIISINGKELVVVSDFKDSLKDVNYGDVVDVNIKRDGKEMTISSKVYELAGNKILGVGLNYYYDMDVTPNVEINFKSGERGPSAGLMTTLEIYNQLTKEDITKGLKIAGTGTIEINGSIGEIGGVRYKIIGADHGDADIFLVPKANYEEAINVKKEKKLDIEIYSVESFKEAIEVLNDL